MDVLKKEQNILALCAKREVESDLHKELSGFENITFGNQDKLLGSDYNTSFDAILITKDSATEYNDDVVKKIYALLKPGAVLLVRHLALKDVDKTEFVLKTNGYVNVSSQKVGDFHDIKSFKPTYEVGSSAKLSFSKASAAPAVWKLDDGLDDDVETIDPDNLLDEDDFKKPDQASLKVCGTTGKRKACKDCSCGLAEELDDEAAARKPVNTAQAKSSCGSCYLGDAFRCASCPYLGMPAFKPGEKVQLTEGLLKADA